MKKTFALFLTTLFLAACSALTGSHPTTAFIVKNTSTSPITFKAGVLKHSQIMGPQVITNSFTIKPNDSVIARQTAFKRDGESPQKWFTTFVITPVDGVQMNDPNLVENWKKGEQDKVPTYTFTLNK